MGAGSAALVAVLVALGSVVGASPAAADTSITVRGGAGEHFTPGRHVALIVEVSSDSLLTGAVRVTNRDLGGAMPGTGAIEVPIEVAGGTEKQVVAVAPTSPWNNNGDNDTRNQDLTVELVDGGKVVASDDISFTARNWEETVGVLEDLAAAGDQPETVPLKFRTGDASLVPVDPLLLGAGAGALDPFHTVAALPSDLAALGPEARATVLDWVGGGGHLLIDAAPGTAVEGLPDAWQPGPGGWASAGSGDIRMTGVRLQQGQWSEVLDPTSGGLLPVNQSGSSAPPGYSMSGSLGVDAGFKIPQLGALLVALSVYVLLVGPITFVVLGRMKRRPLAWLAIPALAVLFTAAFAVTGAQLRNDTEAAHATVIEIGPTGARASTSTLVGSISGGTAVLHHPVGWTVDRPDGSWGGNPWMNEAEAISPALVARPDGADASMPLEPGEFVLVQSSGPASRFDHALEVTASADGTIISGTVRNNLPVELTQVTVLVGFSATSIDRIGANEERSFTVDTPRSMADAPFPEYHRWSVPPADAGSNDMLRGGGMACGPNGCMDMTGFGTASPTVDPESQVNPSVWTQYLARRNDALRSLDTVSVVAWSNQVDSPLTTGPDQAIERGRTALVARAPISVTSLDSVGVRVEVVRETDLRKVDRNYDDAIVNGTLYRIMLPTTIGGQPLDPAQVSIRFPAHLRSVLLWKTDGSYTVVPEPADPSERIVHRLTGDELTAGVVYVRTRLQDQMQMPVNSQPPGMQGTGLTVRTGWEIFTGSVDDVTDTDDEVIVNGNGTLPPGVAVAPTTSAVAQPVPVPTTAAVLEGAAAP